MKKDKNGNSVPKCECTGCDKYAQNTNTSDKPRWRKASWVRDEYAVLDGYVCCSCHNKHRADALGMTVSEMEKDRAKRNAEARSKGFKDLYAYTVWQETEDAKNAGFDNVEDHRLHKLLVKVKSLGFMSVAEYDKHLELLRAKENGFETVREYTKHLELIRARKAGFDTATEYDRHLNHIRAKRAGFPNYNEYKKHLDMESAKRDGYTNMTDWRNRNHKYLKYRKKYCENVDGRFGFTCTTCIDEMLAMTDGEFQGMLEVDHIDGNSENNDPSNLQTLCRSCHSYKTNISGDGQTKGRKTIRKEKLLAEEARKAEAAA